MKIKRQRGQSLVELLVAIGVAALLLPAILTGFVTSRQGKVQQSQRLAATALLKEGVEAVRSVREKDWNIFAQNGTFHPLVATGSWTLVSGSESLAGGFTRAVVTSDVYRDTAGAIVTSGGTLDPSTKKVTLTVSWNSLFPSQASTTIYLARYVSANHLETTVADFSPGTLTNTVITDTSGGEVTLAPAPGGGNDWCTPSASIKTTLNLPGQGVTTAISAIPGHAYTTTGGNASGDALDSLDISNPPQPATPVATLAGNYNSNKAYAVFAGTNNVFIGSDHPGLTVIILNPNTLAQVGFFAASGGERPGGSIYTTGSTGYVTAGNKLYAFDIGSISGASSQTELWNVTLAGAGQRVMVVSGYAYVVTSSTTTQLQLIDLATRAITNYSVGNGLGGVDLFVDSSGTSVYLVTAYASGKNDLFIIDVTNKTAPAAVSSYSTVGMNPTGVVAVPSLAGQPDNRVIIVGSGATFYQVLKTDDKANPSYCGGLSSSNFPGVTRINAVAAVQEQDRDVFSYILTNNAEVEFQAIQGGPGFQYADSGTFESATFATPQSTAFNRIDVNALIPGQTDLKYQVAAADPVGGNCSGATFNFVGPDGTAGSFFATGSALPLSLGPGYKNPGQCFRYRAYFSTADMVSAPILTDVTVNYSP